MKVYCVISHTHWDREWYMPLERFRLRLVDLIDRCLQTLEKYPDFIFHLDAQTIVLEDYLSVRAWNKELLKKYIQEGRLVVGPWYLQNDFYLTSGEATVRNLLEGTRIAEDYGNCAKVGYAPDQFGNISQLPQILQNFGIDNFVFGRGFSEYTFENGERRRENTPSEFIWKGPDGSEVLAVHLKYWYNNAQRFSENIKISKHLLDVVEESFKDVALTPYLLLMNGVDHLEAQDNLLPILEQLKEILPEEKCLRQMRMDEYIDLVKKYVISEQISLPVYEGELRKGHDFELLKGTLSSRTYLKTANVQAQNMLEHKLEPLYSILELAGARGAYSMDHFRYMWKELMKNHPHDSICGCSCDSVHRQMEDRFERLNDFTEEMLRRGLHLTAEHIELDYAEQDDYVLVAVNTTERICSETVEAVIDILQKDDLGDLELLDDEGNSIPFAILSREAVIKDVFTPVNLPGCVEVERYKISLYAENIQPYAVRGYVVRPVKRSSHKIVIEDKNSDLFMQNEFLSVEVTPEGSVNVTDKATQRRFKNVLQIEECGDRGDSYVFQETGEASMTATVESITVDESHAFMKRITINEKLSVPEDYDFIQLRRSKKQTDCRIALTLTLKKGSPYLEIGYCLENTAKDHRVRLVAASDILTDRSVADIPYDIVSHTTADHYQKTQSKVFPNTSFALLENEEYGVAVFTEGTHEYEHLSEGKLAFTLVRSTGVINRGEDLKFSSGDMWICPENQCIRTLNGRVGIMFYRGDMKKADIPYYAKKFRTPLMTYCTSRDVRKFAGGRTAVQDSQLEEIFFLPDQYKNVVIKSNQSYVSINGEEIIVSALKKTEDERDILIRFWNYGEREQEVFVETSGKTQFTNMKEEVCGIEKQNMICSIRSKEILSVRLRKDNKN